MQPYARKGCNWALRECDSLPEVLEPIMLFDDRLATVLRLSATSEAGRRTQFRQLLDLLGSRTIPLHPHEGVREQSMLAAAWLRMESLADAIPPDERARMVREAGWRFRSPELVAHLAEHEPEVASAALARAELSGDQWAELIPNLPIRARGFLRHRRDLPLDVEALLDRLGVHDRGLPAPAKHSVEPSYAPPSAPEERSEAAAPLSRRPVQLRAVPHKAVADLDAEARVVRESDRKSSERSEISALVERIAQFRRDRSEAAEDPDISPRLPLGEIAEPPRRMALAFGFVADASGRIEWASSDFAPMVIGIRLIRPIGSARAQEAAEIALGRAFARRQPVSRMPVTLEGAAPIAGQWLLDAEPRFSSQGHFAGYLGRMRRPRPAARPIDDAAAQEADRIRQLLHELRTPITAVQGYAEVIQQQLFGPAPHEYRALAAAIAADAAHILAGFEELDRLARLETGALTLAPGEADLATLTRRMAEQLSTALASRDAGITLSDDRATSLFIAIDEEEAEGMLWRLLATLAASCRAGEHLAIRLSPVFEGPFAMAHLVCELPARLREVDDPFGSDVRSSDKAISAGLFGSGFSLRLARAEAMRAGGTMTVAQGQIVIRLPFITGVETNPKAVVGSLYSG
jgi:two-component system, OmpR family, sensor kinase